MSTWRKVIVYGIVLLSGLAWAFVSFHFTTWVIVHYAKWKGWL